jgi:hypothetical protein|tara:strand:- start:101 stop:409 length:309 start_codon:yes stop_codon:yes gene_type:complete
VPKKRLPSSVIDTWPEIFKEINVDVVPIKYLDSINVKFKDGKTWEIDIKKTKAKHDIDIESSLEELFNTHEEHIASIDFRLDTEQVKIDIKKRTQQFMKKRK